MGIRPFSSGGAGVHFQDEKVVYMRLRLLILLAAVVVSVAAGLALGHWLSDNAPVNQVEAPEQEKGVFRPGDAPIATIDQNALLPEPPQPRVDGTRGVLPKATGAHEHVELVSAAETSSEDVMLSTGLLSEEEVAQLLAGEPLTPALQEPQPFQVPSVEGGGLPPASTIPTITAGEVGPAGNAAAQQPWANELRQTLAQCNAQSLITRVVCSEQAKWKYCGANAGWGLIPECPSTGNN